MYKSCLWSEADMHAQVGFDVKSVNAEGLRRSVASCSFKKGEPVTSVPTDVAINVGVHSSLLQYVSACNPKRCQKLYMALTGACSGATKPAADLSDTLLILCRNCQYGSCVCASKTPSGTPSGWSSWRPTSGTSQAKQNCTASICSSASMSRSFRMSRWCGSAF